jgi:hypothetical protein
MHCRILYAAHLHKLHGDGSPAENSGKKSSITGDVVWLVSTRLPVFFVKRLFLWSAPDIIKHEGDRAVNRI